MSLLSSLQPLLVISDSKNLLCMEGRNWGFIVIPSQVSLLQGLFCSAFCLSRRGAFLLFCALISTMTFAVCSQCTTTDISICRQGLDREFRHRGVGFFVRLELKIILHLVPLGNKGTEISHPRLSAPSARQAVQI